MRLPTTSLLCVAGMMLLISVSTAASSSDCPCAESKTSLHTKAGVKAATSALAGALGTSVLGSSTIGFTIAGIAKGSLAAYIQAKIGIFGGFSLLQSLGAQGVFALGGPLGIGVGVVGAGLTYWYATSGSAEGTCDCAVGEAATEQELEQLFALKALASCVEPGTSKSTVCSARGECKLDELDDDLFCKCDSGFAGIYCEIDTRKSETSGVDSPQFHRCYDGFIHTCVQCWVKKLTTNNDLNCYSSCFWGNRGKPSKLNGHVRPDVGALETRHVLKIGVMEGTECRVPVGDSCSTTIKYTYEHTDDFLDQVVVFFSSKEVNCDNNKPEPGPVVGTVISESLSKLKAYWDEAFGEQEL